MHKAEWDEYERKTFEKAAAEAREGMRRAREQEQAQAGGQGRSSPRAAAQVIDIEPEDRIASEVEEERRKEQEIEERRKQRYQQRPVSGRPSEASGSPRINSMDNKLDKPKSAFRMYGSEGGYHHPGMIIEPSLQQKKNLEEIKKIDEEIREGEMTGHRQPNQTRGRAPGSGEWQGSSAHGGYGGGGNAGAGSEPGVDDSWVNLAAGQGGTQGRSLVIAVESYPFNGVPIIMDGASMEPAGRTPAYARVAPNSAHELAVMQKITAPNGETLVFEKWDDNVPTPARHVVVQDKSMMLRVSYKKFESRPQIRAYSRGTGMAVARLGEKLEKNVEVRKFKNSPRVQMAINKGMRVLDAKAKLKYSQLKMSSPQHQLEIELKARESGAKKANSAASKARKRMENAKAENAAVQREEYRQAAETARLAQRELDEAKMKIQAMFQEDMRQREAEFAQFVKEQAADIAVIVSRKYGMPEEQQAIAADLDAYAMKLVGNYFGGMSAFGRGLSTALARASGTSATIGAFGENVFGNLWALVTGPWTIMTAVVIIQFFFTMTFIGYVPQVLYMMPIISGLFVFFLNISDTMQPLDWVTHFMAGAAVGYSAAFLLIALGAHKWSFIGGMASFGFWIAWIILAFLGIFQFYQVGRK